VAVEQEQDEQEREGSRGQTRESNHAHESQLDRSTLMAIVEASRAMISELEVDEVFKRVAERAASVLDAEGASVMLFDEARKELVFKTAVGPGAEMLVGERFSSELGIAGQALKAGRAMMVNDVRQNRHFFPGIDAKTNRRTTSLLAAPLLHQGKAVGVVEVLNPREREKFTRRDLELLTVFANMAAAAAVSAQAYDRVSRQARGLREAQGPTTVIGRSAALQRVMELCKKVALSSSTVLLYGETGTGKELAARSIHEFSARRDKPFIAINCAALPESLLESELFGHEKGAFTGATGQKLGRFELADGGTLFLDEIGELSPAIQSKLLRVLQEREFVRVGGTATITCDVRIVAATNRDLKKEIEAGRFRDDLYYRLNVFPITLPPLRSRVEDLPLIVDHFVRRIAPSMNMEPPRVSDEAMLCLMNYSWPGNIRELRNVVERATLLSSGGVIGLDALPPEIVNVGAVGSSVAEPASAAAEAAAHRSRLADHEKGLILKALEEVNWNQSKAARNLGITRDHLRYRIKKYELRCPQDA
jgi:Nif-specific regulatory protein